MLLEIVEEGIISSEEQIQPVFGGGGQDGPHQNSVLYSLEDHVEIDNDRTQAPARHGAEVSVRRDPYHTLVPGGHAMYAAVHLR